jgi:purine-binding chemotaxis protein CheW
MRPSIPRDNKDPSGVDAVERSKAQAGKYMIFKLGDEEYGVEILKVRELIGLMDITRVPLARDYVRGVINLRGKVIPVVDLRLKFGMQKIETTDQTVIIVVQYTSAKRDMTTGILVDEVVEVLDIQGEQIEPPPNLGGSSDELDFILGFGKVERRVVFMIDIGRVLESDDIVPLGSTDSGGL